MPLETTGVVRGKLFRRVPRRAGAAAISKTDVRGLRDDASRTGDDPCQTVLGRAPERERRSPGRFRAPRRKGSNCSSVLLREVASEYLLSAAETGRCSVAPVGGRAAVVAYVVALVAVVVGADVLFFKHHFWPRLMVNVGIVLVFAAFYLRFRAALGGK